MDQTAKSQSLILYGKRLEKYDLDSKGKSYFCAIEVIFINNICYVYVKSFMQRKVAFSAFLLALSLYILLPTADEIVIHPVFGLFLSIVLNVPLVYGVLLSIVIYRGIGFACLLIALLIGGKPIYTKLKERFRKKELAKKNQNKMKPNLNFL